MYLSLFIVRLLLSLKSYLFATLLSETDVSPFIFYIPAFIFLFFAYALLIIKGNFVLKQKSIYWGLFFLLFCSLFNSSYFDYLFIFILMIPYISRSLLSFTKEYLGISVIIMILNLSLLLLNLIPNYIFEHEKSSSPVYALGFHNSNTFSFHMFNIICCLFILLKQHKIIFCFLTFALMVPVFFLTGARTYSYSAFIMIILILTPITVRYFCHRYAMLLLFFYVIAAFLCPIYLAETFLNNLTSNRLLFLQNALTTFPKSYYIFGMPSTIYSIFLEASPAGALVIDSAILRFFFTKGIVGIFTLYFVLCWLIKKYQEEFLNYFPCVVSVLLAGIFESPVFMNSIVTYIIIFGVINILSYSSENSKSQIH